MPTAQTAARARQSLSPRADRAPGVRRRCAFTLVELLVVIGIIALLISILLPALNKARESSNAIKCSSNQRQLMLAFLMFAGEHKNHLPGNWWDEDDPDSEKRAWLRNSNEPPESAPQNGTIFRYVNNSYAVYLCPSQIEDTVGIGFGSNGRYDYASFILFSGAKTTNIKPESRFRHADGRVETVPTPIIMEEEAQGGINGGNNEGGHCETDRFAHTHPRSGWDMVNGVRVPKGGAYYASIDGSVHYFKEPLDATSYNWSARTPGGGWLELGYQGYLDPSDNRYKNWNYWNRQ